MIYKAILCSLFLTVYRVHSNSIDVKANGNNGKEYFLKNLTTQLPDSKTNDLGESSVRDLIATKHESKFTRRYRKQTQSLNSHENEQRVSGVVSYTTNQVSLNLTTKCDGRAVSSVRKPKPQSTLYNKEQVSPKSTTSKISNQNGTSRPTTRIRYINETTTHNPTSGQNVSNTDESSEHTSLGTGKHVSPRHPTTSLSERTLTARITKIINHLQTNFSTFVSLSTTINKTNPSTSKFFPTKSTTSKKQKLRTTIANKKDPTSAFTTLATKSKHHSKNGLIKTTTVKSSETYTVSSPVYSKPTSNSIISQSDTTQRIQQTTSGVRMSSQIFHSKSQKVHTPSIQTMTSPYFSTKHTKHEKPKPYGKTKILINEIAISQKRPEEQFIELKVSSDYTHDLQSYEVVVFSGIGEVLSTMSVHGDTGKPYTILANEDIHVNIRKELQKKKSIAVAVYQRSERTSDVITLQSKGVMDAIVLTAYDGRPSDQVMQNLMKDNATPFHVSSSALTNGGTISRCAENHVRDTQDFMEMSEPKATRGFRNVKCPRNVLPTASDKSIDNIQLTLIVVMSCLGFFFVIVIFVVMIMKQKQRQIKIMQASVGMREDEDEDVVLKMASVKFDSNLEEPPTFDNNVYLTINS